MTADTAGLPTAIAARFTEAQMRDLIALRRELHAHPEIAWQEKETIRRLESALTATAGTAMTRKTRMPRIELHQIAGTGLVVRVPGKDRGAPVVAVRGDIDALPIQEETGLSYASTNPGVMHACGHDVHATWAVAAAQLLAGEPAAGDVLVVLQPAEEVGEGAKAILESGALDGVACMFGGHVDRRFEVGQVVAQAGPLAASTDTFSIALHGAGAHAARPQEGADPIVGAAALVSALQTIVSRRLDPATPGVVTVAALHAGSAPNVIPDRAELLGTVRAVDPASRALMLSEVRRITESVAEAYGLTAEVKVDQGTPPIVNSERAAAWANAAASELLGAEHVVPLGRANMGGEDFAFYLERVDGCFLRIGAREPGGQPTPAHSSRFAPAEASIFVGAAVLAACARRASEALARGVERGAVPG